MKEKYIRPEMDIVEFESEDVIRTSIGSNELPFVPYAFDEDWDGDGIAECDE